MASSVVVSDFASLSQNFSENAKTVLCNAAFGAGAYAIGGRLLGLPALTPAGAIVTAGSLVAALTLCPSNADQGAIFGQGDPGFTGGQCVGILYGVRQVFRNKFNGSTIEGNEGVYAGPVGSITKFLAPGPFGPSLNFTIVSGDHPEGISFDAQLADSTWEYLNSRVYRKDGLPDNCGNPRPPGGQVIVGPSGGDQIKGDTIVDNSDHSEVINVTTSFGGISNSLNLRFGDIVIKSLFPLNFNIDIGGTRYGFGQKPNGDLEPREVNPDPESPESSDDLQRQLLKTMKEVKECVCTPGVELDMLHMPLVDEALGCEVFTTDLLVPKGSVSNSLYEKFLSSALLASVACKSTSPTQLGETLIYAATTLEDGRELFTGEIAEEVISLRLKITDVQSNGPDRLSIYPAANQRKFGSVSYTLKDYAGGGDYIYIFDSDTYLPLPHRAKKGRLRILMKAGVSFEVYDTGERS
jgi:hypothetical protein